MQIREVRVSEFDRSVDPLSEAVNIKDAAIRTGLPAAWIRRHVRSGNLPSTKVGKARLVSPRQVLRLMDQWAAEGTAPPVVIQRKPIDLDPVEIDDIPDDEPF